MEKSSKGLLNRNQQDKISEQRSMPVSPTNRVFKSLQISTETAQLQYYSGSTITTDAGQLAGVSVISKLDNSNVTNDIGSATATNDNTSLSFTSTALTNEVSFLYSISEVYDQSSGNEKLEAITKDFNQGDYCVDYRTGVIYGKKADNSTTLTSTSYKIFVESSTYDSGSGVLAQRIYLNGGNATLTDLLVTGDLTVQGSFNFGDAGVDILTIAGYMQGSAAGNTYLSIGSPATAHSLDAVNDLYIAGELEVKGNTYIDGTLTAPSIGATAILLAADGTTLAPSISWAADTNTGFYRIGTDTIGITTGGVTNINIDADGRINMGFGTGSGNAKLNVKDTGGGEDLMRLTAPAGGVWFSVGSGNVGFNTQGGSTTCGTNTDMTARMNIGPLTTAKSALALHGITSGAMPIFQVNSTGINSGDYFTILQNGKIGIGQITPSYKLEVQDTGATTFNYPFSSSVTSVTGRTDISDSSKAAGQFWMTGDEAYVQTYEYAAGVHGGFTDSGASAPNQQTIQGVLGWNYYNATNTRSVAFDSMGLYGINELGANCTNLTIATASGVFAQSYANTGDNAGNTITTAIGLNVHIPNDAGSNPVTITNYYGVYMGDHSGFGTTKNYALYSVGGKWYIGGDVGVGIEVPEAKLHIYNGAIISRSAVGYYQFESAGLGADEEAYGLSIEGTGNAGDNADSSFTMLNIGWEANGGSAEVSAINISGEYAVAFSRGSAEEDNNATSTIFYAMEGGESTSGGGYNSGDFEFYAPQGSPAVDGNTNGGNGGNVFISGGLGGSESGTGDEGNEGNVILAYSNQESSTIGKIGIGTASPTSQKVDIVNNDVNPTYVDTDTTLKVVGADGVTSRIAHHSYDGVALFSGIRTNGTAALPTKLLTDDIIFQVLGYGYHNGGSYFGNAGGISLSASNDWDAAASSATYLTFSTTAGTSGGSEKMRIDKDGNVGIGTSTPNTLLELRDGGTDTRPVASLSAFNDQTSYPPAIWFLKSHSDTLGTYAETQSNEELGEITFYGVNSNSTPVASSYIRSVQQSASGAANVGSELQFYTGTPAASPILRMTISKDGNVAMGNFSSNTTLGIDGSQSAKRTAVGAGDYNPSILTTDYIIAVDNTAAPRAITISIEDVQSGTTANPRIMIIKDESGGAGAQTITISLESGNIDGGANTTIAVNYGAIVLYLDGTNGFIY